MIVGTTRYIIDDRCRITMSQHKNVTHWCHWASTVTAQAVGSMSPPRGASYDALEEMSMGMCYGGASLSRVG